MEEKPDLFRHKEELKLDEYIIATYYIEVTTDLKDGAEKIAFTQSVGSTSIRTKFESPELFERSAAKIVHISKGKKKGVVRITFPTRNIDPEMDGIPQLLSTISGGFNEITIFRKVKLIDFKLPHWWANKFPGPKFGLKGIRDYLGVYDRPLVGTIVKPKTGLTPQEVAEICYESALGGLDFIKDDEIMASPPFNRVWERVPLVMEALARAEKITGMKTVYAPCITGEVGWMMELAERVMKAGGNGLMVNAMACGFSIIRQIASNPKICLPIHVLRCGDGVLDLDPHHGWDLRILSRLTRIAGGDSFHVGMIGGYIDRPLPELLEHVKPLLEPLGDLKKTIPTISGGVHPGTVHLAMQYLGHDIMFTAGSGISGHPDGPTAGARAMRLTVQAASQGKSIEETARKHPEVRVALEKWGITREPRL